MRIDVRVLQSMVDLMVGVPKFSYPARQGGDRPVGDFAHISLLEEYQVGIPNRLVVAQDDETTTFRTYSPAKLRLRVGVIDTDGVPSTRIMHGWTSEAMKQLMISTGYGFVSCKPISLEDAKLEKEWEPRQGFSVILYATRVFEEVVNNICRVSISGKYITESIDTVLLNYEINEE